MTQFVLREKLSNLKPLGTLNDPPVSAYDAQKLLGRSLDKYVYFAASVFWRASAHNWTWSGQSVQRISFGSEYQEQFRRYLLGETGCVKNAHFLLHISSEREIGTTTIFPCTTRMEGTYRHKFYIPGLLFTLFLGKRVPETFRQFSLNAAQQKGVWLAPFESDSLFRGMLKVIQGSRPQGSLKR
jgi:hypothetical protein